MNRLFVETKYKGKVEIPSKVISTLPGKIVLAMPVQFLEFQAKIKEQLESSGKKVILFKSKHGLYPGQILGCDIFKFNGNYDAFLYVGDGKFHPTALLYENEKPVYCYNPFTQKLEVYDQIYLEKVKQRKQGQLVKFLNSQMVGILVTTKPGQNQSKGVELLREKLEKAGKQVFIFLADEINFGSLENFNFIEVWINSACPRIVEDFKCLNLSDLSKLKL
ncbi:MAG: diphthamide synthesis protein [Candidatus Woesearchaeota archaeon]